MLEKFEVIVEDGVGFDLYEAVEKVKRELSESQRRTSSLNYPGAELEREVGATELQDSATGRSIASWRRSTRRSSRRACAHDAGRDRLPDRRHLTCALVEAAIRARLPSARRATLRSFHSVVQGLARHAFTML